MQTIPTQVALPDEVPTFVGLDIGGANLKLAFLAAQESFALAHPFPMWIEYRNLADSLQHCLRSAPSHPQYLAITMTGELADCFATRTEGVQHILSEVERLTGEFESFVYSVEGSWLTPAQAKQNAWDVAASNWHALANWLAQSLASSLEGPAAVVDIGSTTVDIIPFGQGAVRTSAKTDRDRLCAQQLVYTGIERTPVASILSSVDCDGIPCPVMAERFADSADAYLLLGLVEEDPLATDTADGRGKTAAFAAARLARMIGEDPDRLSDNVLRSLAEQVIASQVEQISLGIQRNLEQGTLVFSGHAPPIVERLRSKLGNRYSYIELTSLISPSASRSAPAFAVASLLRQHLGTLPCSLEAPVLDS